MSRPASSSRWWTGSTRARLPWTTLWTVSAQDSDVPSGFRLEYVRSNTAWPRGPQLVIVASSGITAFAEEGIESGLVLDGGDTEAEACPGVEPKAVLQRGESSFQVADHPGGRVDDHLAGGPGRQPPLSLDEDE